jgi:nucleotide-binding universal stress UspA family protein
MEGDSERTSRDRLAELADELATTMGIDVETTVREGGVVDEILAEETRVGATVTVLGSRGQSRLRRLLLGSTSESVVAQGNNNVLLVPPDSTTR